MKKPAKYHEVTDDGCAGILIIVCGCGILAMGVSGALGLKGGLGAGIIIGLYIVHKLFTKKS